MVPQQEHGAVGEAACTVTVTSLVTLTCSMIRSGRSGRIVIGSNSHSENSSEEKVTFLQYITFGISEAAGEPFYGSINIMLPHPWLSRIIVVETTSLKFAFTARLISSRSRAKIRSCFR